MTAPLFPPIEPFATGWLDVGDEHRIYYEQCGNPDGMPLLFLHGGPGSGCSPRQRQLFDPRRFRAILFDQRGCGRSQPRGSTVANTSVHLVRDIEQLRRALGIAHWLVFAGSWGAGLALAYARSHPEACSGLVLRSVFLGRPEDIDWFFQGNRHRHPQAWADLCRQLPPAAPENLLTGLHRSLHDGTESDTRRCALAWHAWECTLSGDPPLPTEAEAPAISALIDRYRVQSHYLVHGCFWEPRGLLAGLATLAALPCVIVHGELDTICHPQAARDLHAALPHSRLHWVPKVGHALYEPAMLQALQRALDQAGG